MNQRLLLESAEHNINIHTLIDQHKWNNLNSIDN